VLDFRFDAERHANDQFPLEACGVVVDGRYWRCRNISDEPQNDFVIDPRDYAAASLYGDIDGIVHSHPLGGAASDCDKNSCTVTGKVWHIYSVPDKQWLTIDP
jgi:proteasome lid subunit RPN8/RPN11|tara:strand:- start:12433 stop:12741 length:309 start_codon:yes stop_codon:yes gene_type:complete